MKTLVFSTMVHMLYFGELLNKKESTSNVLSEGKKVIISLAIITTTPRCLEERLLFYKDCEKEITKETVHKVVQSSSDSWGLQIFPTCADSYIAFYSTWLCPYLGQ